MAEYVPFATNLPKNTYSDTILGDYLSYYLNLPEVRDAFHIPDSTPVWEACSSKLHYHV